MVRENQQRLLRWMHLFLGLSGIATVGMMIYLAVVSWPFGIDFTGGAEFQIQVEATQWPQPSREILEKLFQSESGLTLIPSEGQVWVVRFQLPKEQGPKALAEKRSQLELTLGQQLPGARIIAADYVGSQVGYQLRRSAILSLVYALILLLVYIGFRFDFHFAVPAILCLVHDVVITFGVYVLSGRVIQLPLVAALLTLVGYSLNDTIVVFDRIREWIQKNPSGSIESAVVEAVRSVWIRTLMTSLTTLAVSVVMWLGTQGAIQDIAFVLSVGILVGTYSSVFVAAPMMMWLKKHVGDRWLALLPKPRFTSG